MKNKNLSLAINLAMFAVGMVCLAYASVPLYSLFCKVTGFAGTTQRSAAAPGVILDRTFTITFNADTDPNLPWEFKPVQKKMEVRVGEQNMAFFKAKNLDTVPVTGTAVFNVTPEIAGAYFDKIQCFCFTNQTLAPGQEVDMPVSFFIDPSVVNDKNFTDVTDITLSYTFFKAKNPKGK